MLNLVDGRYHAQRLETQLEHITPSGLNEHDGPPILFRRPAGTRFFDFDLPEPLPPFSTLAGNPDFYQRTVTAIRYDDWSVPTRWSVSSAGGRQETMIATPARDTASNLLLRYGMVHTESRAPRFAPASTRVELEFNPSSRLVERVVANPDNPQRARITELTRDATGVVEAIVERTWDPDTPPGTPPTLVRSGEVRYDGELLYPTYVGVETGTTTLATTLQIHPALGVLQRMVGPNGAVTELRHDGLGRLRRAERTGAESVDYRYLPPATPYDQYVLEIVGSDEHHVELTLDAFQRVRQRRELSDQPGVWWTQSATFDARGQLARTTLPHVEGEPAPEAVLERDDLGRVTTSRAPSGSETRYAYGSVADDGEYDPRRSEITTPRDHTYVEIRDANGQIRRVIDPTGAATVYAHGPFGRLQRVDLPSRAFREYDYDSNGLIDEIEDSRAGLETFDRDGFGEVVDVVRADGTSVSMRRDRVGRLVRRFSDDGTAFFVYDVGTLGRGSIGTTLSEDGTSETYRYDAAGRLEGLTRGIAGASLSMDLGYDPASGQLQTSRVAGPPGGLPGGAGIVYSYSHGHLTGMDSIELGRGVWRALRLHPQGFVASERYPETDLVVDRDLDATDRRLSIVSEVQALEVTLDEDGNVSTIVDGFDPAAGAQQLAYDSRGRLDSWSWTGTAFDTDYRYDALGNVLRNETGTLRYDPTTRRVASLDGQPVTHDGRGRVDGALGRAMSWRDFDLFDEVQDTATGQNVRFSYTADHERAGWQSSTGASAVSLGSSYRRYQDAAGVHEVFGVPGPGRIVAELVSTDGDRPTLRFVHEDHLGSTAVVSSPDEPPARFWRSPFGRPVDPLDSAFLDASADFGDLNPGFTGHQPDGQGPALGTEGAGFIHMRGREYDPALGQMLTPDPMTPVTADVDGWNPYAYVLNNPSTLVDPSGFVPFDAFNTGNGWIVESGSGRLGADQLLGYAQTAYDAYASPPFAHQQGDLRSDLYEVAGAFNGLGIPFMDFEPRASLEDTARYEFYYTRGQMAGSAVGGLADLTMIAAGLMLLTSSEALPFLGSLGGPEGAAVGTVVSAPTAVIGTGLVAVGGGFLAGYHGPALGQSLEGMDRFYNEGLPSLGPTVGSAGAASGANAATRNLLAPVRVQRHHIFPQRFRDFFEARGINIDSFTVEISQGQHLRSIHGRGDAITPGRFNQRWADFIAANPNATARETYQFGGRMMDEYGLSGLPIGPYR